MRPAVRMMRRAGVPPGVTGTAQGLGTEVTPDSSRREPPATWLPHRQRLSLPTDVPDTPRTALPTPPPPGHCRLPRLPVWPGSRSLPSVCLPESVLQTEPLAHASLCILMSDPPPQARMPAAVAATPAGGRRRTQAPTGPARALGARPVWLESRGAAVCSSHRAIVRRATSCWPPTCRRRPSGRPSARRSGGFPSPFCSRTSAKPERSTDEALVWA